MLDDLDSLPVIFRLDFVEFLEISKNCLAALNDPPGDACSRTHSWVFLHERPGGTGLARCFACLFSVILYYLD